MKNKDILSLLKIIKLGFKKYPNLYFILCISLVSIFTEVLAMNLVTSISNDKYFIFESYLSSIDKNILFSIVLSLFTIRFISIFFIDKYQVFISRKFQAFLSSESLLKTLESPLFEIEEKEIGFFIAMGGDETSRASELLNSTLKIFNFSVLFLMYLIMIFYIDSNIFIILGILFSFSFFIIRLVLMKSKALGALSAEKSRSHGSIFIDALNGIKTVKSFGIESYMYEKYKIDVTEYQLINYKIYLISLLNSLFPLLLLLVLLNIYVLIDYFTNKVLSPIYLISIFFILIRFLLNLGELLHTVNKIVGNLKATNNIINFINKPILNIKGKKKILKVDSIEFESVTFGYNKLRNILSHFDLSINSNFSYAIIGKTGSGKSTLIDLMMNFFIPNDGKVLINDTDINTIDMQLLKEKVIYISQESIIFNDSIKNNLMIDKKYSDEEMFNALAVVELVDMIENFENGLNHILNYKGTNISGGQKQRLNIARAILRDPDVLILDESINALDSITRIKIVRRLLELYKNKIIIFVTHDKDILNIIDNIIDLDIINKKRKNSD